MVEDTELNQEQLVWTKSGTSGIGQFYYILCGLTMKGGVNDLHLLADT